MSINLQSIVLLLLFIAPGFLYSRTFMAEIPFYQKKPDLFHQTVMAVIGSTLIHFFLIMLLISFLFVFYLTPIEKELTLFLRSLFSVKFVGFFSIKFVDLTLGSLAIYFFFFMTYITASMMLAIMFGARLGRSKPKRFSFLFRFLSGNYSPEYITLWWSSLVEEPLRRGITSPRIAIWLRSGEYFEGNLAEFRLSTDEANEIELALDDVIFQQNHYANSKTPTKSVAKKKSLLNHRVLLRSAEILWIARIDLKNE